MEHISSEELTIDQVPDPDSASEHELWDFAHTFDAYTHWGGLREAHAASVRAAAYQERELEAYKAKHDTEPEVYPLPDPALDYLRSEMFMDCRAIRHCVQDSPYPESFWSGLRHGVRGVRQRLLAA